MDIDSTKAPRTYATWKKAYDAQELAKLMVELSVQLEVELNVATVNEAIAENKAYKLEEELEKAQDRINRLEEAGDLLTRMVCRQDGYGSYQDEEDAVNSWRKAKEAKP